MTLPGPCSQEPPYIHALEPFQEEGDTEGCQQRAPQEQRADGQPSTALRLCLVFCMNPEGHD